MLISDGAPYIEQTIRILIMGASVGFAVAIEGNFMETKVEKLLKIRIAISITRYRPRGLCLYFAPFYFQQITENYEVE